MYRLRRAASYAADKASINAGTWYFAPVGACIAVALLLAGGVPMNFGQWIDDPVARSVFEASVCVVLAYVFVFVFWFIRGIVFGVPNRDTSFLIQLRRKVNPAIAAAIFGGFLVVGGLSYYFWDSSRGPVIWTWGRNSPLSFWRQGSDPLLVNSFSFAGQNRSDDPIKAKRAFVTLDSAQVIPLLIVVNGTPQPLEGQIIKAGEKFALHSYLAMINPEWTGQRPFASTFRGVISGFVFVFEYEGGEPYKVRFNANDLDRYIAEADVANRPFVLPH
jgi:hypothetical protein